VCRVEENETKKYFQSLQVPRFLFVLKQTFLNNTKETFKQNNNNQTEHYVILTIIAVRLHPSLPVVPRFSLSHLFLPLCLPLR
jgi:hypothetical protein